jgi:hypothetical protein
MEIFTCDNCKQLLYFENSTCLNCSHTVGFDVVQFDLLTLNKDGDVWLPVNNKKESLRFCANTVHGTCNWLIPVDQVSPFCPACTLNRTIPTLSSIDNQQKWRRIEIAKHRLVYSLFRLGLPVNAKKNVDDIEGIAFDFMEDVSADEKIMTGHDNGVITLNIDEADEGERIRHKLDLGEKYRTLLGHFRHEIGHYYWEVLIKDSSQLQKFRQLFGDEQQDYGEALDTYYKTATPTNWNDHFISPYATSHPWEDWAESWAHYMHMMDTLETAWSFGVGIKRPGVVTAIADDPYATKDFNKLVNEWFPLTFAVNNLNRSMGYADFYPFIIAPPVVEKLEFIHDVCKGYNMH